MQWDQAVFSRVHQFNNVHLLGEHLTTNTYLYCQFERKAYHKWTVKCNISQTQKVTHPFTTVSPTNITNMKINYKALHNLNTSIDKTQLTLLESVADNSIVLISY